MLRYQQESEYEEKIRMEQEEAQRQQEHLEKQRIIEEARTNPLLKGIIDGTIRFYIEPIPSYYQVSGINNDVNNIANALESTTMYGVIFSRVYDPNYADIDISWVKNYGTPQAGVAIFKSVVQVALGKDNCWGDWQPFDTFTVQKIMWHEIGHTLGYKHSNDPNNIMYYATTTKHAIDVKTTFQLESGYSRWFSFCTAGKVSWNAESSKNTDGFDVFAIPPDDPRGFSDSGGTVYLDTDGENCGKKNMISITRYCSVGNGAYLHFTNHEDHTIYITFEMYDENPSHNPNMIWDSDAFAYDNSYLYTVWDMFH